MIDIIYPLVVVVLLFALTVFVHELGHYLVARWCGLKIEVFSIGFGQAIWKTERNGIVYKIGWLPFGGYVALPQMDPSGQISESRDEEGARLPDVAPWRRILVALAGATGNVLLAVFLAYMIFWFGKPAAPHEQSGVVGYVQPESEAYAQGLRPGDVIQTVNGEPVRNWNDIMMIVALVAESVTLEANGKIIDLTTVDTDYGMRELPGVSMVMYCHVARVLPGSSAEAAGVRNGDRIVAFAGTPVYSPPHLIDLVSRHPEEPASLVILRDGDQIELEVTPAYDPEEDRALIGVGFSWMAVDYDIKVHPRPSEQIRDIASMIFRFLAALVTPATTGRAAEAVGGPVFILSALWEMGRNSFMLAIWFTCLLNINLAVLNLLPIPVLDGGHILFALWEMVTRRKVNPRVTAVLAYIFVILLISLMIFLSFRDVHRMGLFPGRNVEEIAPVEEEEGNEIPTDGS